MRRNFTVLGLGLVVVALTACKPTYPNCKDDEHCQEQGEVCVQGTCQECATEANCKEGFRCDGGKCVTAAAGCTRDEECGANKICQAGSCTAAECTGDGECGTGKCNKGRCTVAQDTCTTSDDCGAGRDCQGGRCVSASSACRWDAIPFGFNETGLSTEAQSQLAALATCIKAGQKSVRIEGHADERGTEEYNLQLSNRRAASVKKFLTDLGVPGKLLDSVGYGENKPVSSASTEDAWAANRRVEFKQ